MSLLEDTENRAVSVQVCKSKNILMNEAPGWLKPFGSYTGMRCLLPDQFKYAAYSSTLQSLMAELSSHPPCVLTVEVKCSARILVFAL